MFFSSAKVFALVSIVTATAVQAASHTGDATFYTPGLGACGKTNNENELVAAVAAPVFDKFPGAGPNPNKNPICGKKTTVSFGGKSVTVTIVDRCPGCGSNGIDLSPAAFKKLAPLSKGRLSGAKWSV